MQFLLSLFMAPVWVILAIFGRDPDNLGFYVGLLFLLLYIGVVAVALTALICFIIISGFHMFFTILTWF
jgi:hypothetical protein